jgi:hypothetical protein
VEVVCSFGCHQCPNPHRRSESSQHGSASIHQLASLDPQERREVAAIVGRLSENLAEVPDGKTTSHVLGVLAQLLDPS